MLNQNSRGLYAQVLSVGTLILAAIAVISRLVNFSGAISDLAFWALLVLAVILALLSILANQPAKGNPSIRRDESGNLVVDYRDDGVTVTVPPQGKNNSMQIQKLPSVPIEKLRSANDEYSPARFVLMLKQSMLITLV